MYVDGEEEEEESDGCGADGADEDDFMEFDPYAFIKSLPPLSAVAAATGTAGRPAILPRRTRRARGAATLVLDLDETLVHSTLGPATGSAGSARCAGSVRADFSFDVSLAGRTHGVHVRTRPHLAAFLERCAELYEVVVFTASQRVYADRLLDVVDPGRRFIRHRVFREACVVVEGNYLKDLTVLGRDMARTVIVDNSPLSYLFHPENAVGCISWIDQKDDDELRVIQVPTTIRTRHHHHTLPCLCLAGQFVSL